jgi:hypothetical protein
MGPLQKWALLLIGLGAGWMVLQKPDAFYKGVSAVKNLTAGSVVAVTTGGQQGLNN